MKTKREKYVWLYLFVFSTAFSFAIGPRQENYLLVAIMAFSPILLFHHYSFLTEKDYPFFRKKELILLGLLMTMVLCALRHPESFRISTLIYTGLFIASYIYYMRLIDDSVLKIERYIFIIKFLLIAFCATLIIQQFCVALKLPFVFNQILSWESKYKLNSLSPEPSHTSRILILLMYSYVLMREFLSGKAYNIGKDFYSDRVVWLSFLYPMLTMRSSAAFFFLPFFMLRFVNLKTFIYIIIAVFIAFTVIVKMDFKPVNRAVVFGKAVLSMEPEKIWKADYSASHRIVPSIFYIKMFDLFNQNTWFGYGIDYNKFLFPLLDKLLPEKKGVGGIFPTFLLNYGIFPALILFLAVYKFCLRKILSFDFILWLLLIGPVPLNTQLTWVSFMLLGTNKYFSDSYF